LIGLAYHTFNNFSIKKRYAKILAFPGLTDAVFDGGHGPRLVGLADAAELAQAGRRIAPTCLRAPGVNFINQFPPKRYGVIFSNLGQRIQNLH
jgi:hypothetical protein